MIRITPTTSVASSRRLAIFMWLPRRRAAAIHKSMRSIIAAAILIASISCSTSPTEPSAAGTVALRYGETATIAGTRVSFTEINDSRCPKDVVCAWAGDAAVRLESGSEFVVLHSNLSAGASTGKLAGLTITLIEVKPEIVEVNKTKKTDYVVTIRASK